MVKNGPFGQNYIVTSHSGTQYFLWASLVCLHAWQCRGACSQWEDGWCPWGISHMWTEASLSSWRVWSGSWWHQMDWNTNEMFWWQRCSIRFRSGKCGGHSMVSVPSSSRTRPGPVTVGTCSHQGWTCQFLNSMANDNCAPLCHPVSTRPTRRCQDVQRHSHQWPAGSHFIVLAVLILFLLLIG